MPVRAIKYARADREAKIAEYIQQFSNNIKIKDVQEYCSSTQISKQIISLIADKLSIKVTFLDDVRFEKQTEHNIWKFARKSCLCNKCRVCFRIYTRFKDQEIFITNEEVNIMGNTYYQKYIEEKNKRVFFKFIESQLDLMRREKRNIAS